MLYLNIIFWSGMIKDIRWFRIQIPSEFTMTRWPNGKLPDYSDNFAFLPRHGRRRTKIYSPIGCSYEGGGGGGVNNEEDK